MIRQPVTPTEVDKALAREVIEGNRQFNDFFDSGGLTYDIACAIARGRTKLELAARTVLASEKPQGATGEALVDGYVLTLLANALEEGA